MRLIDADALGIGKAKPEVFVLQEYAWGWNAAIDAIEAAPTIDAVEVVRCRECKYWKHFDHLGCTDSAKVCGLANYMIGANGYCLYGERRSEDE